MNSFKKILQGLLVGVGSILPGVSGGMIAASFNIYSVLIDALDNFVKHPIKSILSIWQYLVGIVIGILIGMVFIKFIFDNVPIPSTLIFIGLIIGGIPEVYLFAKQKNFKPMGIIISCITALVMIGLVFFLQYIPSPNVEETHFLLWMLVGLLLCISLVIPGLSGTMLMMMIGYYSPMLDLGSNFLKALATFNIDDLLYYLPTLIFVAIGFVITAILSAKLLNIIIKKKEHIFYQIVLGIVITSPISIIISLNQEMSDKGVSIFDFQSQWYMWLIGIVLIPVGIFVARKFAQNETQENQESN